MEFMTALTLAVGIGTCNPSGAWCPGDELGEGNQNPGLASLTATLVEADSTRWRIDLSATHYSNVHDNEWLQGPVHALNTGDRGQEFFMLSFSYKLWCRRCDRE